jgi:hypothetical protein
MHAPPMPRGLAPLSLLLLVGCGTFGLDHKSDTATRDSGEALAALRIDAVVPDRAPLAGGTEVTVQGAGFEGDVTFAFGNAQVDVTVVDDETLIVVTPEVRTEATVDVEVESDLGSVTLDGGFTFSDEAGGTGSGTGSGTGGGTGSGTGGGDGSGSGSGSGGSGVTIGVQMDYVAIPCMDCFGLTQQVFVDTVAMFHSPTQGSWHTGLPAAGSCTTTPSTGAPVSSTLDVGGSVTLQTGGAAYALPRSNSNGLTAYLSNGMGQNDYVRNASWDLVVGDGGSWGPFTVTGALQTTSGFTDVQPIDLFEPDSWYAFAPLYTSSFQMSWAPAGVSDLVVVDIQVYDQLTGTAYPNGNIVCTSTDTGFITIPAQYFGSFYQGDLASVFIYRWDTNTATNPADGTTVEGMTVFGAIGTATLY